MNPIGELLALDDVHMDVDAPDKARLLQQIASLLARRLRLSYTDVFESLTMREDLGSTGLGHGVAIPHARMPQCYAVAGVFVRTRVAIPFDAPDHRPVSLFLALVVPKQATERHLQLLATAATMFNERAFREKLRAESDPDKVRELLMAWPDPPEPGGGEVGAAPGRSAAGDSQ